MRPVTLALSALLLSTGAAVAQTTTPGTSGAPATSGTSTMAAPPANTGTSTMAPTSPSTSTMAPMNSGTSATGNGQAAVGGNDNQAVATTNANAMTPASGHNSFTKGEARHRIHADGYTKVTGLHKDTHGVWRGQAMKDGQSVPVWLDYKGNVGSSQS